MEMSIKERNAKVGQMKTMTVNCPEDQDGREFYAVP